MPSVPYLMQQTYPAGREFITEAFKGEREECWCVLWQEVARAVSVCLCVGVGVSIGVQV